MAFVQQVETIDPKVVPLATFPAGRPYYPSEPKAKLIFTSTIPVDLVGVGDTASLQVFFNMPLSKRWAFQLLNFSAAAADGDAVNWTGSSFQIFFASDQQQVLQETLQMDYPVSQNRFNLASSSVAVSWSIMAGGTPPLDTTIVGPTPGLTMKMPMLYGQSDPAMQPNLQLFCPSASIGAFNMNILSEWLMYDADDIISTMMYWQNPVRPN